MRAAVAGNSGSGSVTGATPCALLCGAARRPATAADGSPRRSCQPLSGHAAVFIKFAMDDLRAEPEASAAAAPGRAGRFRRFVRRCLRILVVLFGLSVMLTAIYRFAPVPLTPL